MTTRKSWEKLPDETPKAYHAFTKYLQMPPYGEPGQKRSIAAVGEKLGLKSTSNLEIWSAKYRWIERAAAYDSYRATTEITVTETALHDFQQNVISTMSIQLVLVNEILDRSLAKIRERQLSGEEVELKEIKQAMDALKSKDDLARRMAGLPTQFMTAKAEEVTEDEIVYTI